MSLSTSPLGFEFIPDDSPLNSGNWVGTTTISLSPNDLLIVGLGHFAAGGVVATTITLNASGEQMVKGVQQTSNDNDPASEIWYYYCNGFECSNETITITFSNGNIASVANSGTGLQVIYRKVIGFSSAPNASYFPFIDANATGSNSGTLPDQPDVGITLDNSSFSTFAYAILFADHANPGDATWSGGFTGGQEVTSPNFFENTYTSEAYQFIDTPDTYDATATLVANAFGPEWGICQLIFALDNAPCDFCDTVDVTIDLTAGAVQPCPLVTYTLTWDAINLYYSIAPSDGCYSLVTFTPCQSLLTYPAAPYVCGGTVFGHKLHGPLSSPVDYTINGPLGTSTCDTIHLYDQSNPVNVATVFNGRNGMGRNDYVCGSCGGGPSFNASAPPSPGIGRTGDVIVIYGSGFTGVTNVSFNGTTATYTVVSDTTITVVIPPEATTGPISVTTGSGTTNTPMDFFVIPVLVGPMILHYSNG
jgi:hypothetical protein